MVNLNIALLKLTTACADVALFLGNNYMTPFSQIFAFQKKNAGITHSMTYRIKSLEWKYFEKKGRHTSFAVIFLHFLEKKRLNTHTFGPVCFVGKWTFTTPTPFQPTSSHCSKKISFSSNFNQCW